MSRLTGIDVNSKTLAEQKSVLENVHNRPILDIVRDDSSSLLVLRDSESLARGTTLSTSRSSRWSLTFPFDGEILKSQVYQRAIRRLFRRIPRSSTPRLPKFPPWPRTTFLEKYPSGYEAERAPRRTGVSEEMMERMERNQLRMAPASDILLKGDSSSGVHVVFWKLLALSPHHHSELIQQMLRTIVSSFELYQRYIFRDKMLSLDNSAREMLNWIKPGSTAPLERQAQAVKELWLNYPIKLEEKAESAFTV